MSNTAFLKRIPKAFWLAILIHFLLLCTFTLSFTFLDPVQVFEKKSDRYLPAYLYEKEGSAQAEQKNIPGNVAQTKATLTKPQETQQEGIAVKKQEMKPQLSAEKAPNQPATTESSSAFIEPESIKTGKPHNEPLLKELSRATAAKLYYPPEAAVFKLKGTATVSFLLYPDGTVTDVTLYQSSGFAVLDNAAIKTIQAISPVRDANLYINKPQVLLAGIIFG